MEVTLEAAFSLLTFFRRFALMAYALLSLMLLMPVNSVPYSLKRFQERMSRPTLCASSAITSLRLRLERFLGGIRVHTIIDVAP